jgi:hypothetical protein
MQKEKQNKAKGEKKKPKKKKIKKRRSLVLCLAVCKKGGIISSPTAKAQVKPSLASVETLFLSSLGHFQPNIAQTIVG